MPIDPGRYFRTAIVSADVGCLTVLLQEKGSVLAELEAEDSEDHNSLQDDARARWWVYACVSQSSVDARTTIPERLATCDTLQRLTGSNLVCPSAAVSVASN
jgi:hypothetical protein